MRGRVWRAAAAAVVLVACGETATQAPPTTGTAAPVTTTSTAGSVTPTSAPGTAPTVGTVDPGEAAWCEDRSPLDREQDATIFPEFGSLGTAPSLQIELPGTWTNQFGSVDDKFLGAAQVPGGVLVSVRTWERTVLAVVDFDGTVRWRRCVELWAEPYVPPVDEIGEGVVVVTMGESPPMTVTVLDLADGASRGDPLFADQAGSSTPTFSRVGVADGRLLLQPVDPTTGGPGTGAWRSIDLVTYELAEIDAPPADGSSLVPLSDGRTGWAAPPSGPGGIEVVAVLEGTRWVAVPDGSELFVPFDRWQLDGPDGTVPAGFDLDGSVRWQRDDIRVFSGEAPGAVAVGDVVVAMACTDSTCSDVELRGLDQRTGADLWVEPDLRSIGPASGGFALARGRDGGAVITIADGRVVPGQVFPDEYWPQGCCADPSFTSIDGGIVVASTETEMRVYLPAEASTPTVSVRLLE